MINPIVTFIFGIISGCTLSYFVARTYWVKKLQITRRSLLKQYDSDLAIAQQHNRILEDRERRWLGIKGQLEQQLEQETRDRQTLERLYDASAQEAHSQIAQLSKQLSQQIDHANGEQAQLKDQILREREKGKAQAQAQKQESQQNVDSILEESQKVEHRNRQLNEENERILAHNQSLIEQQKQLEEMREQEAQAAKETIKQARKHAGIDFEDIIKVLFPKIVLQQDSALEINNNVKKCGAILRTLKAIENKERRFEKVKGAKHNWFKSTKSFHLQSLRVYYCADTPNKGEYAVLVSEKKNQERDIRWMKSQH